MRTDPPVLDPNVMYMRMALREAAAAADAGEVPVGAVMVHEGHLIAKAHNQVESMKDPTAHAEILAITQAAEALKDWRLNGAVMYVTKEPCPMCAGALVLARVAKVIWGVSDPQRGGAVSVFKILQSDALNHRVEYATGILEDECRAQLQGFFKSRRAESSDSN